MIDIDRSRRTPVIVLDLGPFTVTEVMLDTIGVDLGDFFRALTPPVAVVDLSPTHHLGSKAVSVLIQVCRIVKQRKGRVAFCQINAYSLDVLHTLHLDQHWEIYATVDEALTAVG